MRPKLICWCLAGTRGGEATATRRAGCGECRRKLEYMSRVPYDVVLNMSIIAMKAPYDPNRKIVIKIVSMVEEALPGRTK
jgi:hypothetical protein